MSQRRLPTVAPLAGIVAAAMLAGSCGGPKAAFQAAPPRVYVAKVKNLLVGLAPTDAEVQAVESDAAALGPLVDGWMQFPEYSIKMRRFFELAFQQSQITSNDFLGQMLAQVGLNDTTTPLLLQNVQESFARTMVELTSQGHPLTEAMTTQNLMMTTALKELYGFLDVVDINDDGAAYDHFRATHFQGGIVAEAAQGPIPIAQSVDPSSPNFLHWYDPDVANAWPQLPGCQADPVVLGPVALTLHYLLLGTLDARTKRMGQVIEPDCPRFPGTSRGAQFTPGDFDDWTMVRLRQPMPGETATVFYDLPALRAATELVLSTPRLGFFSTPAFQANWPTNVSNQMRVTTNQAFIVATGSSVDGTDATSLSETPGLDAAHVNQPACVGCHKILDPSRSVFSATWSWYYHRQLDPALAASPGLFAFRGVVQPVQTLADFGSVLASHPLVAPGWVQKLCYYANSAPCDESDPEFHRLVGVFQGSSDSWSALVKAFMTSPITTLASDTRTAEKNGEVVAVSRRDHFCAALDARLGFHDGCGLGTLGQMSSPATIPVIVSGLPSDAYGRGAVAPILPNAPTIFSRAGIENICENVAAQVIDAAPGSQPAGVKQWSSAQPDAAIGEFVSSVMALVPSDPRFAPAVALLKAHFSSAVKQPGVTPTEALQSTFVVACLAPSAVSIGL